MPVLLKISQLNKRFGGVIAVKDVNLEVEQGMIFSIIGPNGAGKTTFFNLVTGFYPPDSGEIFLSGPAGRRAATSPHGPAGHRPHLSEYPALSLDERRAECNRLQPNKM
jgi:branched-chain amino acid transport system ATP-binding protein